MEIEIFYITCTCTVLYCAGKGILEQTLVIKMTGPHFKRKYQIKIYNAMVTLVLKQIRVSGVE